MTVPAGTQTNKLTFLTKFAFGMGDFWTSIGNIAMATYLTMFYTDVVKFSPAMIASMLLVVRVIAAFWDLLVGILVDRTDSKWGKARPWMLAGGILYGIAFLFLFTDPFGNSLQGAIYAWIIYTVVNIAYSTVNDSYASLTSLLTSDSDEKTSLNIYRMTIANIAAMLVYILAMPIIGMFANKAMGWSVFFGVIAVMIPFGYWFTFHNTHEKVTAQNAESQRVSVLKQFRALAGNKYWWVTLGLNFALWIYNGISNGMAAYISTYVLGNSNLTGVIGLATVIPLIIGLPLAGPLIVRFGKRNLSLAGLVLVVAGSLLVLVNPYNTMMFFVSIILRMFGMVPMNASLNAMSGDVVEYGEKTTGVRSDGIVFSSSSFSMKIAMGVSSAAIAWVLAQSGYVGGAPHQAASAIHAMIDMFVWAPIAMVVVIALLLFIYDLDDRIKDL
ncbi:MFS transporter [Bifidobacterium sp. ESL0732]|uniref:MFS transporter n=1 Tax=Bifidobacterium sp. ESL0732 TaxID=2983222 RepID=UPI0023F97D21|nr:MFS transporter [Bifidobacterium sp. ESL0732]WEV64836.1 MFS transporter [Bifidobacterium sp. ESL0732]